MTSSIKPNSSLRFFVLLALFGFSLVPLSAQAPDTDIIKVVPRFELGYAKVLFHEYQSGDDGIFFNFLTQGGQDTLYPFQRLSLDAIVGQQHTVTLLYQPLTLNSRTVADRNNSNGGNPVVIDGVSFPSGTPLDITYGFDFWRASYL